MEIRIQRAAGLELRKTRMKAGFGIASASVRHRHFTRNHLLPTVVAVVACSQQAWSQGTRALPFDQVYNALEGLTPLADRVASVQGLVLHRDVARLTLHDGDLVQLSPVGGRSVAFVFVGSGTFSFTPPTRVEQNRLAQTYGSTSLEQSFGSMLLVSGDSTVEELERQLSFGSGPIPDEVQRTVEEGLEYLVDRDRQQFNTEILGTFLNQQRNSLFYAHLRPIDGDPLVFAINPYAVEGVSLFRPSSDAPSARTLDLVCQFTVSSEGSSPRGLVSIGHYVIENNVATSLDYSATTTVRLNSLQPGLRWAPLILHPGLTVDSVEDEDGDAIDLSRAEESSLLWLHLDPEMEVEETRNITMYYHGDLIRRQEDTYFLQSSTTWYPRHAGSASATFEMTFHTPARLAFATVGRQVSSQESDDLRTTRWVVDEPVRNVSFALGRFEQYEIAHEGIPHTIVLSRRRPIRAGSGLSTQAQVSADVANSLQFFKEQFGEPLQDAFVVAEIPYLHGEAFPGFVHLSLATFFDQHESFADKLFRAHEMAHQWWGVGVEEKTYRDRWLTEGLAQFSALWFLDDVLRRREEYESTLRDWRLEIADRGDAAGPIAVGGRHGPDTEPGDDELIVYNKGAWVFHMLRMLMRDPETKADDEFAAMMRDFYATHRGGRVGTEDFKQVVEKHIGMDMTWFFDQWVYGTAAPAYRLSHKMERAPDGKHAVRVMVGQGNTPADFRMPVPVQLHFEDGDVTEYSFIAQGPITFVDLPSQDRRPTAVTLNSGESVLASVESGPWWDARVRVATKRGDLVTGRVTNTAAGVISLAVERPDSLEGSTLSVDPSQARQLYVGSIKKYSQFGLVLGAAAGAAGGAYWGLNHYSYECADREFRINTVDRVLGESCTGERSIPVTAIAVVVGGAAGGFIGRLLGSRIVKQRWTPVRMSMRPDADGSLVVTLEVQLGSGSGTSP